MKGSKMHRRSSLHQTLQQRVFGSLPPHMLLREARGSKYLVQCLQKESALTGHEGCVNSIAWNDSGEYLLSGADDCLLNIYRPADRKLIQSIRSGHRANIFSAKFLPYTGDRKIVSCAGDGTIHFTDVDRESSFGQFQFDCHGGTTYEVITTPGDPNTFLSCGEDGTVRLFDLRTKIKCLCRSCKEDILIDCGKPVTSINLNPIMPYHLGVGCEDSTVRVFDRRALSSSSSNKMKGMFCQFKPESLTDRNYRVTSLHYSPNGSELLVSYCADYVYLFNVQGAKQSNSSVQDGIEESGCSSGLNGQRHVPPLKRLRLRGDWSDTGPNARPESEHPSPENSLMQRMSDMFARWLDESSRAGQRHRARRSSSRSASSSSSSVSASPSGLSSSSAESSSTSGTSGEDARRRRNHERSERPRSGSRSVRRLIGREQISNDDSMDLDQDSITTIQENNLSPQPAETKEEGSGPSTCTTSVELIPHCEKKDETSGPEPGDSSCVTCRKNTTQKTMAECNCNTNSNKRDSRNTRVCSKGITLSRNVTKATGEQERLLQDESFDANVASSIRADNESTQQTDHSNADSITRATKSCSVCSNNIELSAEMEPCKPHSLCNTRVNRSLNKGNLDASHKSGGLDTEEEASQKATNDISRNARDHTESSVPRNTRDYTHRTHGNESSDYHDVDNVSTRITRADTRVIPPRVEANSYRTPRESFNESSSVSDRTLAATRIQRVFRHHKSFLKDDGDGAGVPKMVKVYKGHRNSRTMIKEANFWGDDYVLSGSDCGRIFIWDKYTAELVMILQGDKHVVNCVQPHPFDPILASSGIDYDIKLWVPIAAEAMEPLNKEEIILRNEKMLEESRDTITVPASFMIRMLASLNNARFGQRNRDEDTDSDSSDD